MVAEASWMTIGRQIMDVAHGVPASMVGGLSTPEAADTLARDSGVVRQAEAQQVTLLKTGNS